MADYIQGAFRQKGNDYYQIKDYKQALISYTLGLSKLEGEMGGNPFFHLDSECLRHYTHALSDILRVEAEIIASIANQPLYPQISMKIVMQDVSMKMSQLSDQYRLLEVEGQNDQQMEFIKSTFKRIITTLELLSNVYPAKNTQLVSIVNGALALAIQYRDLIKLEITPEIQCTYLRHLYSHYEQNQGETELMQQILEQMHACLYQYFPLTKQCSSQTQLELVTYSLLTELKKNNRPNGVLVLWGKAILQELDTEEERIKLLAADFKRLSVISNSMNQNTNVRSISSSSSNPFNRAARSIDASASSSDAPFRRPAKRDRSVTRSPRLGIDTVVSGQFKFIQRQTPSSSRQSNSGLTSFFFPDSTPVPAKLPQIKKVLNELQVHFDEHAHLLSSIAEYMGVRKNLYPVLDNQKAVKVAGDLLDAAFKISPSCLVVRSQIDSFLNTHPAYPSFKRGVELNTDEQSKVYKKAIGKLVSTLETCFTGCNAQLNERIDHLIRFLIDSAAQKNQLLTPSVLQSLEQLISNSVTEVEEYEEESVFDNSPTC